MFKKFLVSAFIALTAASGAFAQENPASKPEPRTDEGSKQRHASFNERAKQGNVDLAFIGDSITQGWEGAGKPVWDKYYGKRNAANFGIGGDRTQHVIWRIDNGNLDGIKPKLAVLMIGTNNVGGNTPAEISGGIATIVERIRAKTPDTKILLLGVFPRDEKADGQLRAQVNTINSTIAKLDDGKTVFFMDINAKFLQPDGSQTKEIMPDTVHLSEKGYQIWADAIESRVVQLLGEQPVK